MKTKILSTLLCCALIASLFIFLKNDAPKNLPTPSPTNGSTMVKTGAEEGDNQEKREAWFELMHQTAPGTDWRSLEHQTSFRRHLERVSQRRSATHRGGGEEVADGHLYGEWKERGSRNQSGNVLVTEYDAQYDRIYAISAGGTLWRGSRDGFEWEVVNQDLRFHNRFLKIIETDDGPRMLTILNDVPHYSDDMGESWKGSAGVYFTDDNGETRKAVVLEDGNNTIFLLSKKSFWDDATLYRSTNNGTSFQTVYIFDNFNFNDITLHSPHGTDQLYVAEKVNGGTTRFFKYNPVSSNLELIVENSDFGFTGARANLIGIQLDTTRRFWAYNGDQQVHISEDEGKTWNLKGNLPKSPWSVGLFVSPSNPDLLLMGEVECYKSLDGGANWYRQNGWGEYYDAVESKLHADMMYFNEFESPGGETFLLISNHGGLSISYDEMNTTPNISLLGLNVSQYYDVRTDPQNSLFVYAGSQDQGFQRGIGFTNDVVLSMEQVISGDYGHLAFTGNNQRLWLVYPGGWISYYANPQGGYLTDSWEVDSDDESVWIPPLIAHPDPARNAVLLAGGNKDGGEGSYIIQLEYSNGIQATQLPFDFKSEADGQVSALGYSSINPQKWYAATTNGRFFYSNDEGQNWEQTINFVPTGHYLYGASIYASKLEENTVYYGGSGYSNPAVYKSTDGGATFVDISAGLPPTLVFELTANADESLLFAATEAGPYVYVTDEAKWFDLSGISAPSQTYWSVEYLEADEIIRFGTYGRGIWDFQIMDAVSTNTALDVTQSLNVYPNPVTDILNIDLTKLGNEAVNITVLDLTGKQLQQQLLMGQTVTQVDVTGLPKGGYILHVATKQLELSHKFIRQ